MSGAKRNPETENPACESAGRGAGNKLLGRAEGGGLEFRPPSSPGEFHPEALTEPDLSLSTYPARATP